MFEDYNNMPYKMDCKYDFNFKGDEPIPDQNMGLRIASREPWQTSILDPQNQNGNDEEVERCVINMDKNEVKREKIWNSLAENLF
jgi:hypothetical protein